MSGGVPVVPTVTAEWVKNEVEAIRKMANDDESAHAAEDDLHIHVLKYFASKGGPDGEIAAEALKTQDIDFWRWCA